MRRKTTFLVTLWWVILCGAVGACLLVFADPDPAVSEEENRTLAGMPELTIATLRSGSFSESFENFLTDKFFMRSELVDGTKALRHAFSALTVDELLSGEGEEVFVPTLETQEQQEDADAAQETIKEIFNEDAADQTTEQPAATVSGEGASVWLEHRDGTKTAVFTYSMEDIESAAQTLNGYAALLPEGGTLHVLLAPRAQTANRLALHLDTETGWNSETEAALRPLVSNNVSVHSAYDILEDPILSGEYVYFRTDHHWTARGAYLAAQAMLESAGYQTVPLGDYQEKTIYGFLGSIYLHGRNAKLRDLADSIEVFYPLLPSKSFRVSNTYQKNELTVIDEEKTNYLVFLGGTHGPYRYIEGGYQTGRNMLMICDSFGNSIAPFFLPYYDKVYMVDFRGEYYTKLDAGGGVQKYVRSCGIDDIYIVLSDSNSIGSLYFNRLMPENID